jgi:hypothetical protein
VFSNTGLLYRTGAFFEKARPISVLFGVKEKI